MRTERSARTDSRRAADTQPLQRPTEPLGTRILRGAAAVVVVIEILGSLVGYPLVLIGVLGPGAEGPTFKGPILEAGLAIGLASLVLMVAGSIGWRRLRPAPTIPPGSRGPGGPTR